MKPFVLKSETHLPRVSTLTNPTTKSSHPVPFKNTSSLKPPTKLSLSSLSSSILSTAATTAILPRKCSDIPKKGSDLRNLSFTLDNIKRIPKLSEEDLAQLYQNPRFVMMGTFAVGILMLLMDDQKALALGPEGPLLEEFWENVRRYGIYFLTVSTGALYTVFQPILELLKNPISAILIIAITVGSIFIVSQVLSAMVGISDFAYDYGY